MFETCKKIGMWHILRGKKAVNRNLESLAYILDLPNKVFKACIKNMFKDWRKPYTCKANVNGLKENMTVVNQESQ